jgi:hypothetical protein
MLVQDMPGDRAMRVPGAVQLLGEATRAFRSKVLPTLAMEYHVGAEATLQMFTQMATNQVRPGAIHRCTLWPYSDSAASHL